MNYDEPEYPEPTAVEAVTDTPAPTTVVMTVTGYDAQRVESMVADRLFEQARQKLSDLAEKYAEQAVTAAFEEQIGALLRTEAARIVAEGWQRTSNYGEPCGPKVTLRERISQALTEKDRYQSNRSWLDETVREEIQKALKGPFGEEIAKARAAFKTQVDELLGGKIAEGLRAAFGLGR